MNAKPDTANTPNDIVLVHSPDTDGRGYRVLRQRGETLQAGVVRPLENGKPIHGEVVRLTPREESPLLFDVDVQHDAGSASLGRPAKVATDKYRSGWDSIWAKAPSPAELN